MREWCSMEFLPCRLARKGCRDNFRGEGHFYRVPYFAYAEVDTRLTGRTVDRSTGSVEMPNWSVPVIVRTFPRTVRVIEHTLIPLKDGTLLAARIWLPDDAEQNPVPAILEYLPYRKRDGTYQRDALTHPYLAGHGYAGVRVH